MHITRHATEQAAAKGFDLDDVADTAKFPHVAYPSLSRPGQERRVRSDLGLCVVVDPSTETIITVYTHCVETPRRPDQEA